MEKKTVLITGVTGAIGKATALEMAKNNCRVLLLARNASKAEALKTEIVSATGNSDIDIIIADLSEPRSVRKAAADIKSRYQVLNALINVAAIFRKDRIENSEGMEYMFATNHMGPFILTNELLDILKAGHGRVITVSAPSTTKPNFDDLQGKNKFSAGFMGMFGATKLMNIQFTYALARRVDGTGVTANVLHPGLVKSELTKDMPAFLNFIVGMMSGKPDKAAKMLTSLALEDKYEGVNGKFFNTSGKELKSSAYTYDTAMQEKLWSVSEALAG